LVDHYLSNIYLLFIYYFIFYGNKLFGSGIVCFVYSYETCSYKIICRKGLSKKIEKPFTFSALDSNLNHGICNELGNQYGFCTADNQKVYTVILIIMFYNINFILY
jgi:hypothetical protein